MPTQDSFDPMLYLAIMHGETTLSDLKTGRQNLSFEVSERTGQLKDLVSPSIQHHKARTASCHLSCLAVLMVIEPICDVKMVTDDCLQLLEDACIHYIANCNLCAQWTHNQFVTWWSIWDI